MLPRVHQAFRSELVKLLRPRLLWPLLGSVAAAAAAVAAGTAAPSPVLPTLTTTAWCALLFAIAAHRFTRTTRL
ncbi:hypothetical protein ACFU6K_37925 [Kitasatospora sp. NPDC057512]|uniref:hypothetical protein n=1 Tax=Kitasatospora sp. NPDC057512 TaxID=3346154 RepID=UPI0036828AE1